MTGALKLKRPHPPDGIIACLKHGVTSDWIRSTKLGGVTFFRCRQCIAAPCKKHGQPWATLRFGSSGNLVPVCLACMMKGQ